jgi:hypothetical protein
MRARRWGRIALLSSYHATEGTRGSEFYGARRRTAWIHARLAWDTGADGVFVNVIAPGLTLTDRSVLESPPSGWLEKRRAARAAAQHARGRRRVVTFVCSEANGNLTGEIIPVTADIDGRFGSRREFLAAAGQLAAGSALAPSLVFASAASAAGDAMQLPRAAVRARAERLRAAANRCGVAGAKPHGTRT